MESLKDDLEMMKEKLDEKHGLTSEELVDIDFEISVTDISSDADIITEVSGHVYIDDEGESHDKERPINCTSKLAFNDYNNLRFFIQ